MYTWDTSFYSTQYFRKKKRDSITTSLRLICSYLFSMVFFGNIRLQIKLLSRLEGLFHHLLTAYHVFLSAANPSLCMYVCILQCFLSGIILSLHLTNMYIKHVNPYLMSLTIECLYPFVYSSISATAFSHCHWLNGNEGEY